MDGQTIEDQGPPSKETSRVATRTSFQTSSSTSTGYRSRVVSRIATDPGSFYTDPFKTQLLWKLVARVQRREPAKTKQLSSMATCATTSYDSNLNEEGNAESLTPTRHPSKPSASPSTTPTSSTLHRHALLPSDGSKKPAPASSSPSATALLTLSGGP